MSENIRVLHVFGVMNRGGAESMIMNLYRNIDRNKIQFDFMVHTSEKGAFDDEIKSLGGEIYHIPKYTGKNHFNYKKKWEVFFQNHEEHKIIHSHIRSTASIYLEIAKKYNKVTIAHSHSTSNGKGFDAFIKNMLQIPIKNTADYLFAASDKAGLWLYGEKAIQSKKYYKLNNAIETKKYVFNTSIRNKKRKELQLQNKFVIGHVGRFHESKNHNFIIEIFREVYKLQSNSVLVLIGEGDLKKSIEEKVKKYNLVDNVIFLGVREDVNELLQAIDVFIFPSLFEGLPVTVIEAQASGLPVILSKNITHEVAITDLVEFLPLEKDPKDWGIKTLENYENNERENMEKEIINANYDVKIVGESLQKVYLSMI